MITNEDFIYGYSKFVIQHIENGWDGHVLSFRFNAIGGRPHRVIRVMEREVERVYATVYATLLTRMVRKPRSNTQHGNLPIWIGCPYFRRVPKDVPEHEREELREV